MHARFFLIVCFIVMLHIFLAVYVYIYIYTMFLLPTNIYIYISKFKFTAIHLLRIIEVVHYVCYMFANNNKGNYQ